MIKKRKKLRPLGDILLDLEPFLEEMVDKHNLQTSDILGLLYSWIDVHRPNAHEEYLDGTRPKFYGPEGD